jgi:hypothetical protein
VCGSNEWRMSHESAFFQRRSAAFIAGRHCRRCLRIWSSSLPLREQLVANVTRGRGQTNASRLCHVALSISFISPMARRPDTLFATNIASLIFLPDLRFLALTSFQSLNRPSLSLGSSSRISLLKQSFSVSRPRLRPPGNIHRWSPLLLTNNTRPRFVATSFDDFAIRLPHCLNAESSVQILFHPVHKKGNALSGDLSKEPVPSQQPTFELKEAANTGGITECVVLRPPEPKAAPRHGHQLARS